MSILLIVLSWAVLGFSVWFSYRVIRDLRIANRKRQPMATMNVWPNPDAAKTASEIHTEHFDKIITQDFIKRRLAEAQAAIDDKMPDDAILTPKKKPKAMTAPIKRNKPKRKPQTKGKSK